MKEEFKYDPAQEQGAKAVVVALLAQGFFKLISGAETFFDQNEADQTAGTLLFFKRFVQLGRGENLTA